MRKIMAILCILTLILTIGCTKQTTQPTEEQPVTPATPTQEEVTPVTPTENVTEEAKPSAELLSDVKCADGKIFGTLTNTADFTIEVEKDVQLIINGLINRELGCGKTVLASGEATLCDTLNGRFPIRTGKNRLTAKLDGSEYDEVITCE